MDQCLSPAEREGLFVCWLQERSGKSFSTKAVTVGMCSIIHYWCLNNLIPWVHPSPQLQNQTLLGLYFIFNILQMAKNGSDEAWVHTIVYTKCQISGRFTGNSVLKSVMKFGNLLKGPFFNYLKLYIYTQTHTYMYI